MIDGCPSFVPSDVCLRCDGCCRFAQAGSIWCAHISETERSQLTELERRQALVCDRGALPTVSDPAGKNEEICIFFTKDFP